MNPTSSYAQARIDRAIERARTVRYQAHYLGTHPEIGAQVYQVRSRSNPGGDRYLVYAEQTSARGGFQYAEGGLWVRCTCRAAVEFRVPCWHAARVSLRLDREHRAQMTATLRSVRSRGGELFDGEGEGERERRDAGREPGLFTAPEAGSRAARSSGARLEDMFAA